MLSLVIIAAAALMGLFGHHWAWIVPLAVVAATVNLVFPASRLASIRERGAFFQVWLGVLPLQAVYVALAFAAGHFLARLF